MIVSRFTIPHSTFYRVHFVKYTNAKSVIPASYLQSRFASIYCKNLRTLLKACNDGKQVYYRRISYGSPKESNQEEKSIAESKLYNQNNNQMAISEKVKQTTKDVYYTGIIIAGIGVTALMFYAIFRELFSKQSPNSIYSKSLALCKENPEIKAAVGEPIKGYGELSARGRRRHISHIEYVQDGVNYMRMKFYIEGSRKKGTVHLEMRENNGRYEYRYLFVDLDAYPHKTIVIEDNR